MSQFHFDPDTYREMVTTEVPGYEALQAETARAAAGHSASRVLELGIGTGETTAGVLRVHPDAAVVAVDESGPMLAVALRRFPDIDGRVQQLQDELPDGPFDLVVSVLAVHHLDATAKADLFRRVASVLATGGRFVLGDVVVPDDPEDVVTPIDWEFDLPSRADEQLAWLRDAGLFAQLAWSERDLVVIIADHA